MADNTMTLALDGNVPLREFAIAIEHFAGLIDALASHMQAKDGVEWIIDDLVKRSAIATVRGESKNPQKVAQVIQGFAAVATALQTDVSIPYSNRVRTHANQIRAIINHQVTAVRFETATSDIVLTDNPTPLLLPAAYGAVEGRIQTLTNRVSLRFTLFDAFYDRAVSCYLEEGNEEIVLGAWGHMASIEGIVARDPDTGRPVAIRGITSVETLLDDMPHYHEARSILQVHDGAPSPEEIIRKLRDA